MSAPPTNQCDLRTRTPIRQFPATPMPHFLDTDGKVPVEEEEELEFDPTQLVYIVIAALGIFACGLALYS